MLELRLLGAPCLSDSAGPLAGRVAQRHRLALLALAGVSPDGMARDRVLALLWPDRSMARARASLNESVYVLRCELGEDVILTSATSVCLNPDRVGVDVREFQAALAAGASERAASLYTGPLLDGFFLGVGGEFDEWIESERTRLDHAHRALLERLARAAAADGDDGASVQWWRRLAAQDRYDARIARALMEALVAAGNRPGALEHARIHAALLRAEFETGPDAEVEALAQRIRQGEPAAATLPPSESGAGEPPQPTPAPAAVSPVAVEPMSAPAAAAAPADVGTAAAAGSRQPVRGVALAAEVALPARRWHEARRATLVASALILLASVAFHVARLPRGDAADGAAVPVTLAVLPFHNLATPEDRVLSIGIADAIITRLATVERMRVRPTSAILAFESRPPDVAAAGAALHVEHVLTGTIQRVDGTLRVNVQLVRVADGIPVWGDHYQGAAADLLALQDQVAGRVAMALRLGMSDAERERLYRSHTRDAHAAQDYMRGRAQLLRRVEGATRAAVDAFEAAIARDPGYALAHAGLALACAEMHLRYSSGRPDEDWGECAMRAAHRALDLDADLGEAHEALAAVFRKTEFDWARTIEESRRAIALNRSLEWPHYYMAGAFFHLGLLAEADRTLDAAEAANPTGDKVELLRTRGMTALFAGRFDDAVRFFDEAHRRSDRPIADWSLGLALFYTGETARAESMLRDLSTASSASASARARASLASLLAARGQHVDAARHMASVTAGGYMDHHVAYSLGAAEAWLGRPADAVRWLRQAAATGFPCYPWFTTDPLLRPLREDAGFQLLLRELGDSWHSDRDRYRT
jgi:DNA-binding SARP family transcriptional activator/TolB-like protein